MNEWQNNPFTVPDQGNREVRYADKKEIQDGILEKYPPERKEETPAPISRTAAVRHSRTAPRTSRRELRRGIKTEAASLSVPHRRKNKYPPA